MTYQPPFTVSLNVLRLSQNISHAIGMIFGEMMDVPPVTLRKQNSIKTIQASLAIEGNTLSREQIIHILEGKRVIGPKKDVIEVKNALRVEEFDNLNPLSIKDLLSAHRVLMAGLIEENGQWRRRNVGIFDGLKVSHVAPQAKRIRVLMESLFDYLARDTQTPWLIKACLFHYELEFIHPFLDGNGRMGRLWQHLLLTKKNQLFKYIPVEELIKDSQEEYYRILGECDRSGDATLFIEYSLTQILQSLEKYREATRSVINGPCSRLDYARRFLTDRSFARKDYFQIFKNISSATASRDLDSGVRKGALSRRDEKNQAMYRFT